MSMLSAVTAINVITGSVGGLAVSGLGSPQVANFQLFDNGRSSDLDWYYIADAVVGSYEVIATLISGGATGTFGAKLPLAGTQSWSLTQSGLGFSESVVKFDFYKASEGAIMGTAIATLSAEVFE